MADYFVEDLPKDLMELVEDRKYAWEIDFDGPGLNLATQRDALSDEDIHEQMIQSPPPAYWPNLFETCEEFRREETENAQWVLETIRLHDKDIVVRERAGPFIPGLPDDIVLDYVWPCLQTQFRCIAKCSTAEKGEILETFRSLRCLSKRWKDLVTFSYEWAVFRMVRWDFTQGWVWWSYNPSLVCPLSELARMVDLLPEPKEEVTPYLHHKMGILNTEDLWIWRAYMNHSRYLRYKTGDIHLHCGIEGIERNGLAAPCKSCSYYPSLCIEEVSEGEEGEEEQGQEEIDEL